MPQIGGLLSPINRNQSKSVKKLEAAVNKARKDFMPIPLDKTGIVRGESFQYWSKNEFRRCVVYPLAKHGVTWSVVFVPCPTSKSTMCVGVLSFEDEWKESTLEVREGHDLMGDRSWKTQHEKILGDCMLQPLTEDAENTEPEELEDVTAKRQDWEANWKNAVQAFDNASTEAACQKVLSRVREHVAAGTMNPASVKELEFRLEGKNFTKEE